MSIRRLAFMLFQTAASLASLEALAVESQVVSITDRWSVVGIIAGDTNGAAETGIAVIRNNATKRTYTVAIGDALPTEFGVVLKSLKNRTVTIGDATGSYTLSFAEPSYEDTETVSETRRFIDNYYKTLGESAAAEGSRPEAGSVLDGEVDFVPVSRFGDAGTADRSRFGLYRSESEATTETVESYGEGDEAARGVGAARDLGIGDELDGRYAEGGGVEAVMDGGVEEILE